VLDIKKLNSTAPDAEIVEKVLDFPAPEPIFYEHIMIDGVKMSASLGNVIYPKDWLQAATPQLLRFFYNKRLMMTRSFSWKELPHLYDEYDDTAMVYAGKMKLENEKEEAHIKRMYEISNKKGQPEKPLRMSFVHATMLAQTFNDRKGIMESLKKTGQYDSYAEDALLERAGKAAEWVRMHAPEEFKFEVKETITDEAKKQISPQLRKALKELAGMLKSKDWKDTELFNEIYELCKKEKIQPKEFFMAAYMALLGKERGPRLAPFVLTLGERAIKLLEQL